MADAPGAAHESAVEVSDQIEELSTEALLARVLQSRPAVAVFDCDGTLWARDAGSGYMHWSMEQGIVSPQKADWILERHSLYRAGSVGEVEICGDMTRMYAGLKEEELRAGATRFFREHIEPHIFAGMRELTHRLAELGTELWAVSSTNSWVIEEGVQQFGIPRSRVLAARAVFRNGMATDEIVCVPSGEAKREALHLAEVKPDAVFGNSIHDAAMLQMAASPYAVNPTPALLLKASAERWPVYWPPSTDLKITG